MQSRLASTDMASNPSASDRLRRIQAALNHSDEPAAIHEMLAVRRALKTESAMLSKLAMAAQAIDRNDVALELLQDCQDNIATQIYGLNLRLELGEHVADRIGHLCQAQPAHMDARLLWASALHAENRIAEAIEALAQGLTAQPHWIAGHQTMARLRWISGHGAASFENFARAHLQRPFDDTLWASWMSTLMLAGELSRAEQVYAEAQQQTGALLLTHMVAADYMSLAGNFALADKLFSQFKHIENADFSATRMRHAMRTQRFDAAISIGEAALAKADHGECWAWLSAAWRLTDHPKWAWYCPIETCVTATDLQMSDLDMHNLAALLRRLHESSTSFPLGQSPRGGTQTMGPLLRRAEPIIRRLRALLFEAVQKYSAALPHDPQHPFLRRKSGGFRFAGAWSIRLGDSGHHVPHIHSQGWISSAFYVCLPPAMGGASGQDGWLDFGIPQLPEDCPLPPAKSLEPVAARLALFPSILWHGTRPYRAGERLTVAFDIIPT
jgi:tetratricopeptide (TPR) repeat protein